MSGERVIVGVDPGANGAAVALRKRLDTDMFQLERSFRLARGEGSVVDFFAKDMIKMIGPFVVYLEKVHGFGHDGAGGSFKFGANYGLIRGCVLTLGATRSVRLVDVTPQAWMKDMGVPPQKGQKARHREEMREMAGQLQSEVEPTNWNAAAILISFYGLKQEGEIYG